MENNREITRYCRRISSLLPCKREQKVRVMEEFQSGLAAFLEEHPGVGMAEIQAHFGEPQTVAAAYLEGMDSPEVLRRLQIRRRIVKVVAAAVAAAFAIWLLAVAWAMYDEKNDTNGTLVGYGVTATHGSTGG